jgi:hypothetical protein
MVLASGTVETERGEDGYQKGYLEVVDASSFGQGTNSYSFASGRRVEKDGTNDKSG